MDITEIYRTLHQNTKECMFLSAAQGIPSKQIALGHEAGFNEYRKTEIPSCILSDNHGMKLDMVINRNHRIYTNYGN